MTSSNSNNLIEDRARELWNISQGFPDGNYPLGRTTWDQVCEMSEESHPLYHSQYVFIREDYINKARAESN